MIVSAWIGVGLAALLALSFLAGLAIARTLGTIGDQVGELLDAEPWTSAPLTARRTLLVGAREIGAEPAIDARILLARKLEH